MKRLLLPLTIGLLFALAVGIAVTQAQPTEPAANLRTLNSGHHFLPPYPNDRDRFGFDSTVGDPVTDYDVAVLNAGWYSDWGANSNPAHPDGLTYVQLVRFTAGTDRHDPEQVKVSPSKSVIAQIAAAHPGSLWLMGNEPDSFYQGTPLFPDVYAHVYHEYYNYIKGLDPTALFANGGIVQPTPCRMAYLDLVLDTYWYAYGETMPVDVWNIHAFILREVFDGWGASTPPGVDPGCGIDYPLRDGDNIDIFRDNLITFRQWMVDKGEGNKPLIISEYGVLWPASLPDEDGRGFPPDRVSHFMTQTFDLFLYEAYPNLGYSEDDDRLVQAWAWYSLSYDPPYQRYNGYLFDSDTKLLSPIGHTYADYTANLPDTPYIDLTLHPSATSDPSVLQHVVPGDPYGTTSATLPILAYVANLGKLPASDVPVVAYLPDPITSTISVPARYTLDIPPSPVASVVLTQAGIHELELHFPVVIDPENITGDPRPWNNVVTATLVDTVDARPDLVISSTSYSAHSTGIASGTLNITLTVANQGTWPSRPVSGSLKVSTTQGVLLLSGHRFSIPTIGSGMQGIAATEVTLSASSGGLYRVALEVDSDDIADEQDESNNTATMAVDGRPDLTISATGYRFRPPGSSTGALTVTLMVTNNGPWPTLPVSTTLSLGDLCGSLLLPEQRLPVPALTSGAQVTTMAVLTLPVVATDIYHLVAEVDGDGVQNERNEDNNKAAVVARIVVTTTLQPDASSVLTSTSGHLAFAFPAGTVVTGTEIRFTPLLAAEVPLAPLAKVTAFRLSAYREAQPVSLTLGLPVTVTWRYSDTEIAGLDEDGLALEYLMESGAWEPVFSPAEQRWPDENRLQTAIQELGEYVFGQPFYHYLPLAVNDF